jgi:hypothetical protein
VTVTRWTRYGKDRLYVHSDDGSELGWWDLQQNEAHPATPGALTDLASAVTEWQLDQATTSSAAHRPAAATDHTNSSPPGVRPAQVAQASGSPSPSAAMSSMHPGLPPVVDLAYNAPSAQLRGQVEAARAAGQKPTLLRRIFLGKHAYSTWERGLIGEQLVEAELRKLVQTDPWWGFINSIPVGENGADIDHLVVGLAGVFTINTKYHRGCSVWVAGNTYMVNGQRQPFIHNPGTKRSEPPSCCPEPAASSSRSVGWWCPPKPGLSRSESSPPGCTSSTAPGSRPTLGVYRKPFSPDNENRSSQQPGSGPPGVLGEA